MSRWGPAAGLAVALMTALAGHGAWARPTETPLRGEVETLIRRKLANELEPGAIDRLLREPRVRAALSDLFEGWDGVADELRVGREDGQLVVQTLIRERRCLAQISLGLEVGPIEPVCDEAIREDGDRRLVLGEDLWRVRPKPKPHKPPEERAADVRPAAKPEPQGPVDNTVLRRVPGRGALELGTIALIRGEHEQLKERLRRPHYKDPLLPADVIEAGEALRPLSSPVAEAEARSTTNLRNPFDPARLRTDLPVPDMLTLPNDPRGYALLPAPSEACNDEWRGGTRTPLPPTLDCYRRVAWHARLEDNDAYQALSAIASVLQLPLLDTLIEIQVKEAVSHQAHRLVWALVWVTWVKDHPERAGEALAQLTPEERRFLRRRLADWWVEAKLAELRPLITRLFERNFLDLYPEGRDLDGLPRRAFLNDTWLWANNWLAILDGRPAVAITAAYQRLSPSERKVIGAFVHDVDLSRRWARAAEVIASL